MNTVVAAAPLALVGGTMGVLTAQLPGFIVGAVLGTALGWATNARREARRVGARLDVLERNRDERGSVSIPWRGAALFIVVALTVYSAVVSQIVSNKVTSDAAHRSKEIACTSHVLFQLSSALDTRTQLSGAQAAANIDAWKAQLDLLTANPDGAELTPEEGAQLLATYVTAIQTFLNIATSAADTNAVTPYPDPDKYAACLKRARG